MSQKKQLVMEMLVALGKVEHKQSQRADRDLSPAGLSRAQFTALVHLSQLHDKEDVTITSMLDVMNMNQPGVTKVVKSLADQGLVTVSPKPDDKRAKLVSLTQAGHERCDATFASLEDSIATVYSSWTKQEISTLTQLLRKLSATLDLHK